MATNTTLDILKLVSAMNVVDLNDFRRTFKTTISVNELATLVTRTDANIRTPTEVPASDARAMANFVPSHGPSNEAAKVITLHAFDAKLLTHIRPVIRCDILERILANLPTELVEKGYRTFAINGVHTCVGYRSCVIAMMCGNEGELLRACETQEDVAYDKLKEYLTMNDLRFLSFMHWNFPIEVKVAMENRLR